LRGQLTRGAEPNEFLQPVDRQTTTEPTHSGATSA
jgi:hypothetical protein